MLIFLLILSLNGSLARDICTKSAVLAEFGAVKMAVPKKVPLTGDLSVQKELVDLFGKDFQFYCTTFVTSGCYYR